MLTAASSRAFEISRLWELAKLRVRGALGVTRTGEVVDHFRTEFGAEGLVGEGLGHGGGQLERARAGVLGGA